MKPTEPTHEAGIGGMQFGAHLTELRTRLLRATIAVAVGSLVAYMGAEPIIAWLSRPLTDPLVFISPAEAFWANLKVGFIGGIVLAFPFVAYQGWKFIEPGLYATEKRLGALFVVATSVLFFAGVAFCAYVVFPFAIGFLLSYRTEGLTPMLSIGTYVDFNLRFFLAFGLIFQLPPILTLLSRMGLVTPASMRRNRKYAVLGAFVVAAILTPTPDVFNQCLMAVPLMLLYELGILCSRWFGTPRTDDTHTPQ